MIKVKEVIIVEGKYDKIKLSSIIDGLIIETNGFGIFKDKEKMDLIRRLANEKGILILTDSDAAGFMIRNYILSFVPNDKIKHAYIPNIYGKEKRKKDFSKEGKIGVEGISKELILESLKRAGVICNNNKKMLNRRKITRMDFFEDGLFGKDGSSIKRKKLMEQFNLPEHMAVNALIDVLNTLVTYDEYKDIISRLS